MTSYSPRQSRITIAITPATKISASNSIIGRVPFLARTHLGSRFWPLPIFYSASGAGVFRSGSVRLGFQKGILRLCVRFMACTVQGCSLTHNSFDYALRNVAERFKSIFHTRPVLTVTGAGGSSVPQSIAHRPLHFVSALSVSHEQKHGRVFLGLLSQCLWTASQLVKPLPILVGGTND